MPWPNYHVDRQARERFPPHDIPYFVVINPGGVVVFSHAGLDEEMLRATLASVDIASAISR